MRSGAWLSLLCACAATAVLPPQLAKRNADYDAQTRHGAAQGATYPSGP
jgi:hypothetical protein